MIDGNPILSVSGYYWRDRIRARDSARSRGSQVVLTPGLNTQRMSAVQKVWPAYVYAAILLQHGPGLLQYILNGTKLENNIVKSYGKFQAGMRRKKGRPATPFFFGLKKMVRIELL